MWSWGVTAQHASLLRTPGGVPQDDVLIRFGHVAADPCTTFRWQTLIFTHIQPDRALQQKQQLIEITVGRSILSLKEKKKHALIDKSLLMCSTTAFSFYKRQTRTNVVRADNFSIAVGGSNWKRQPNLLSHYGSLSRPQICWSEALGMTLTHIQSVEFSRAFRQDLPVCLLILISSHSIHTLQEQAKVWVLLHCEPGNTNSQGFKSRNGSPSA